MVWQPDTETLAEEEMERLKEGERLNGGLPEVVLEGDREAEAEVLALVVEEGEGEKLSDTELQPEADVLWLIAGVALGEGVRLKVILSELARVAEAEMEEEPLRLSVSEDEGDMEGEVVWHREGCALLLEDFESLIVGEPLGSVLCVSVMEDEGDAEAD